MSEGWISIYRKMRESWIYNRKPFDYTHAWIDLLLQANHEDKKISIGNEVVLIERGSFITSIRKLCDAWGWSNTKIKNFLNLLQNENMICYKSDTKKTTVSIVNYSVYQDRNDGESISKTTQKRHENDAKTKQKHTNNNDNNVNNDNKDNKYCPNSNEFRLSSYLFKWIKRNNEKAKEPNFQTWSKSFDKILRIDKRDLEEVKNVIEWSQKDNFWCVNILSPNSLRSHYDRLLLEMKKGEKNGTTGIENKQHTQELKIPESQCKQHTEDELKAAGIE